MVVTDQLLAIIKISEFPVSSSFEPGGREFESLRARHHNLGLFRSHDTEAGEPNSAARHIHEDVRRFDVPMDEPARMHMVQRPRERARNFDQCAPSASNDFSPLKRYIGSRLIGSVDTA